MYKLAMIAIGGGLGAVLRHLAGSAVLRLVGGAFPWAILAVNASGCLVFGLLAAHFAGQRTMRVELEWALLIGLLGGYTTYSTYAWQTVMLAVEGRWGAALANVLLTTIVGFAALWLGYRLGMRWLHV